MPEPDDRIPGSVLVVDDDGMIRDVVATALRTAGFDVSVAADGEDALALLSEAVPDVVVTDVNMPRLDGLGLARRIRADPQLAPLPLIFLTTRDTTPDLVAGLESGGDDYVVKPFQVDELVARVRSKVARPSLPRDMVPVDVRTGLLAARAFTDAVQREMARAARSGHAGCVAVLQFDEAVAVRSRLGARASDALHRQAATLVRDGTAAVDQVGRDSDRLLLLMPEVSPAEAAARLQELSATW